MLVNIVICSRNLATSIIIRFIVFEEVTVEDLIEGALSVSLDECRVEWLENTIYSIRIGGYQT